MATESKVPSITLFLWEECNLCVHMYLFPAASARKAGERCYSLPTWKHLSIFQAWFLHEIHVNIKAWYSILHLHILKRFRKGTKLLQTVKGMWLAVRNEWTCFCRGMPCKAAAGELGNCLPGLETAPSRVFCLFPWWPPSLYPSQPEYCLYGTAVLVSKSTNETQDLCCTYTILQWCP